MIDLTWILNLVVGVAIGSTLGTLIGYKIFEKMFYKRRRRWIKYTLDALEEELRERVPKYMENLKGLGTKLIEIGFDLLKPEERKDETTGVS
jgi:hypothetical protein